MPVIDTNVLAYLLLDSDQHELVERFYQQQPLWQSDRLILIEFVNIFATYVRTGRIRLDGAHAKLVEAKEILGNELHDIDSDESLRVATLYNVSGYDARFLAVAERLGTKLVTADARLRAAAPNLTRSINEALQELQH